MRNIINCLLLVLMVSVFTVEAGGFDGSKQNPPPDSKELLIVSEESRISIHAGFSSEVFIVCEMVESISVSVDSKLKTFSLESNSARFCPELLLYDRRCKSEEFYSFKDASEYSKTRKFAEVSRKFSA
jgi:hypothetical protein